MLSSSPIREQYAELHAFSYIGQSVYEMVAGQGMALPAGPLVWIGIRIQMYFFLENHSSDRSRNAVMTLLFGVIDMLYSYCQQWPAHIPM